ncbi:MAG: hypothetical protein HOV79_00575 [Hamadaea sp.]|nr:hypothetical protein [Hamadaea sp.]
MTRLQFLAILAAAAAVLVAAIRLTGGTWSDALIWGGFQSALMAFFRLFGYLR